MVSPGSEHIGHQIPEGQWVIVIFTQSINDILLGGGQNQHYLFNAAETG